MPSIMVWDRLMAETRLKGEISVPAEGSVLPDTYAYTTGETRAALLKRMQAAMDKAFAGLWAKRSPRTAAKDRNQELTPPSIVGKETGLTAHRRHDAARYPNPPPVGLQLPAHP